jgi:hypothetical protein
LGFVSDLVLRISDFLRVRKSCDRLKQRLADSGEDVVNKSDVYFVFAMFFTCMGCYAVLTTGFVFFARRLQRKGS